MNKAQLIEAVALEAGISKVAAKRAVDAVVEATIQTLMEGDKISFAGLGTFSVGHRSERTGRNPRTGQTVRIAAKRVVKFRPTLELD
ncbi:MAG: HU family DNA-binding protein [Rikenellaceae bacterium]|nr:HU family DNA-binding protein [Rikenellaceae bacterium]